MPELRAFVDSKTPPSAYDFESIRLSRQSVYPDVKDASHVLVDCRSKEVVAALSQAKHQIAAPTGELTLFWKGHSIYYPGAEVDTEFEVVRTFSHDREEERLAWLAVVAPFPSVLSKFFTASASVLWISTDKGGYAILDSDRASIVTVHDQWRDSDKARGVTRLYSVKDKRHPMLQEALWTAFSLRT